MEGETQFKEIVPEANWPWEEKVAACGANFSMRMEQAFVQHFQRSCRALPPATSKFQEDENRLRQFEIMLDYLVGTAVAIASNYGSLEEAFEDTFLEITSQKFERLREMKKEAECKRLTT